jgi:arginine decarboxylase
MPYPPGIPMSMPGERLGGPDSPVIRLILAMEEFGKRFPGFERETHGIEVDANGEYWMRAVIESPNGIHVGKKNGRGKQQRPPSSAPPVKRRKKPLPGDLPDPGAPGKIQPER